MICIPNFLHTNRKCLQDSESLLCLLVSTVMPVIMLSVILYNYEM